MLHIFIIDSGASYTHVVSAGHITSYLAYATRTA